MVGIREPPYQRDGGQGMRQNCENQSSRNVQSVVTPQGANTVSANTRFQTRDRTVRTIALDNE